MDPIRKIHRVEVLKALEDGSQEIVISTESEDRDGEVIEVDGWVTDNYLLNPVVLYAHDYRSVPIGRTLDLRREPGSLIARFQWREPVNDIDPVNQIRGAWDQGILRAASVGFRPLEWEPMDSSQSENIDWYWGPKRYKKQELLEWSIVPIPANQDALRRAYDEYVKSLGTPQFQLPSRPASLAASSELDPKLATAINDYLTALKSLYEVRK
jgi:phage head maturation protease